MQRSGIVYSYPFGLVSASSKHRYREISVVSPDGYIVGDLDDKDTEKCDNDTCNGKVDRFDWKKGVDRFDWKKGCWNHELYEEGGMLKGRDGGESTFRPYGNLNEASLKMEEVAAYHAGRSHSVIAECDGGRISIYLTGTKHSPRVIFRSDDLTSRKIEAGALLATDVIGCEDSNISPVYEPDSSVYDGNEVKEREVNTGDIDVCTEYIEGIGRLLRYGFKRIIIDMESVEGDIMNPESCVEVLDIHITDMHHQEGIMISLLVGCIDMPILEIDAGVSQVLYSSDLNFTIPPTSPSTMHYHKNHQINSLYLVQVTLVNDEEFYISKQVPVGLFGDVLLTSDYFAHLVIFRDG